MGTGERRSTPAGQAAVPRIGLLIGGRLIEEHVARDGGHVTVGRSGRCSMTLSGSDMPWKHTLLELRRGTYHINLTDSMTGRVHAADGVVDIEDTASRRIALDDRSRGRIGWGGATLLFHFVPASAPRPRPQLPSGVRGAWASAVLSLFLAAEGFIGWVWACSFVASIAMVAFFHLGDWSIEDQGFRVETIYDRLLVQPVDRPEPLQGESSSGNAKSVAAQDEGDLRKVVDEQGRMQQAAHHEPRKGPSGVEQRAASEAARKARLEAALNDTALLTVLGSVAGDQAGTGGDMLKGGGVSTDIDNVLSKVAMVKTGGQGETTDSLGGDLWPQGSQDVAHIGGPVDVQAVSGKVDSGWVSEKPIKGMASSKGGQDVGGAGILDTGSVNKVVKGNMAALRNCYEKGLKNDETLEGKISVKFTIGTSGYVTGTAAQDDTLGDPAVATCVLDKFSHMKFDKPAGGEITFVFPIVFKSAR